MVMTPIFIDRRRREASTSLKVVCCYYCCCLLIFFLRLDTATTASTPELDGTDHHSPRYQTQRLGQHTTTRQSISSSPDDDNDDHDGEIQQERGLLSSLQGQRDLADTTPLIQFRTLSMTRKQAVSFYTKFCPDFSWFYRRGCTPSRGTNPNTLQLCGHQHTLRRIGIVKDNQRRRLEFVYRASRAGISSTRNVRIVCPYDAPPNGACQVQNALCQSLSPSKPAPPSPAPVPRSTPTARPPTRFPTLAPTPRTQRECRSCITGQSWMCPISSQCGCNAGNCLNHAPVCSCETMVPIVWNAQNEAVIELCQDVTDNALFGYRLPGQDSCHLAAIMIRTQPGNSYRLTIRNNSSDPTNLHTHGLHISGDGNADNPFRSVESGGCIKYYWDIPANHMGGTHWMHSHHKNFGYTQVRGGAVAMFIVEENQELLDNVDANSKPGIEQWLSNELLLLASRTLLGHRGNGLESNRYNVTLGEWYRLRIVGVEMDGNSWRLRMPFGCTVLPVAHDGVWRFLVPGPPPASSNEFRMTPAGRLDVAIRCNRRGTFQITAVSDVIASSNVATLNVVSGTTTSATPFTSSNGTWAPKRPAYLEDLIGAGIPDQLYNISVFSSSINGVNFAKNPSVMEVLPYGTLQEWTIINAADPHSFHQHVHHFQVVDCPGFSAGEFYDTIQPNTSTPCIVRTRLNNYGGNLFFHCHTITHSEMGAAALFNVTGGGIVNPDTDMDEFVC